MTPLFTEVEYRAAKNKDELPLRCLHCEGTFYLTKAKIAKVPSQPRTKADFCSKSCAATYQNPPITVQCLQCHGSFRKQANQAKKYPNHFCGHSCAALYNNAHKTTGTRVSKLERWLQTQLPMLYPDLEFHFNRKDAINSELDIYCPALTLAFELNGIFHYEPIYGPEKLASVQNNDQRKFQACIEHGIELCLIDVSQMKNFKEKGARRYLCIIQDVIDRRISD